MPLYTFLKHLFSITYFNKLVQNKNTEKLFPTIHTKLKHITCPIYTSKNVSKRKIYLNNYKAVLKQYFNCVSDIDSIIDHVI